MNMSFQKPKPLQADWTSFGQHPTTAQEKEMLGRASLFFKRHCGQPMRKIIQCVRANPEAEAESNTTSIWYCTVCQKRASAENEF